MLLLLCSLGACSSTRLVRPLEQGQAAVGFDFGGPLIDFAGLVIPVPFTSVTGAYGVTGDLTAFGSVHATAAAAGVFQMELGVVKSLLPESVEAPRRFNVSIAPVVHLMARQSFRLYPEIDINAYWRYGKRVGNFAYVSVSNWFDFWAQSAHGQVNRERYIPNLALGHTFVTPKMRYTLEARWLAPFSSNANIVVGYNGIGGQGSLGVYFSVYRYF